MSIWGGLLGGLIGFSFGGPFGALLGSFLGSKLSSKNKSSNFIHDNKKIFALSLIILTAKLSKIDGLVSKEELFAIKEKLKIPDEEISNIKQIFDKAKQDPLSYEPYAQQIYDIFNRDPGVLEEVINILLYVAEADGNVSSEELSMISNIGKIFGIDDIKFKSILESRKSSDKINPFIVLGCKPEDDLKLIRKKYIELSKLHHPDILNSKGVPKELIDQSKKKMRSINLAWDQVQKIKNKN